MERLTSKQLDGKYHLYEISKITKTTCCDESGKNAFDLYEGTAIDKLGAYEDAEEQGLLYRKIFFIGNYCHKPSDCPLICEYCSDNYLEVKDMVVEINRIHIYGEIGKTVFLTEEEAEQALKKWRKTTMNKGITIFINGIGYYFDDYDRLIELLDMNCNDAAEIKGIENAVVFD